MIGALLAVLLSAQIGPVYAVHPATSWPLPLSVCSDVRVLVSSDGQGMWCCNGTSWSKCGPPTDAVYLVAQADSRIPNAVALTALDAGMIMNSPVGIFTAYRGTGAAAAKNWLTAISATGVGTWAQPRLSDLANPLTDTTFTFPSAKKILWTFTGNTDVAFSIDADGAFVGTGDVMHLHKSGTGSTAGADLLHLEVTTDTNMTGLRLTMPSSGAQAATILGKVDVTGTVTATQFTGPLAGNANTATALSTSGTTSQFWRGDNTWAIPPSGSGGGANSVEVDVDFGDTYADDLASTVVTGQTWVTATSKITCAPTMLATSTRDEGAEDAMIEGLTVAVHSRVVGTGFTVTAAASQNLGTTGIYKIHCIGG